MLPKTKKGFLIFFECISKIFLLISVGIHIIFTLWFLATWPFDQLCRTYDLDDGGWWIANEYGLDKESAWKMCDQNFFSAKNFHTGDHSWWMPPRMSLFSGVACDELASLSASRPHNSGILCYSHSLDRSTSAVSGFHINNYF